VREAEVVVVDNASTDGTVERVRRWEAVRLIANSTNRGFAGAVNQGIAASDAFAVLLLNPDTTPVTGIDALERVLKGERVGAATGRLLGADGHEQHGFNIRALPSAATLFFEVMGLNRMWPGNPVNRRYRHRTPVRRTDIEQPAGAFLMVRRSAWAEVGGLDEGFFPIWFEDVDFCKRLLDQGYRIVFEPDAVAGHYGGHSAGRLSWKERQLIWYGSLLRYASKHFSRVSRTAVCAAVVVGSFARSAMAVQRVGVAEAVSVYFRVVCLTGQCLRTGERRWNTPVLKPPTEEQF
jgi:GT2 family glycosyltransferase